MEELRRIIGQLENENMELVSENARLKKEVQGYVNVLDEMKKYLNKLLRINKKNNEILRKQK